MTNVNEIQPQTIVIDRNKGITHSLKKHVESMPNAIISDGIITKQEWSATMDKLAEINQKRIANGNVPIFRGGTDKSSAGWHSSFVVDPNQNLNFTSEEMKELYDAMGVSFATAQSIPVEPEESADTVPVLPGNSEKDIDTAHLVSAVPEPINGENDKNDDDNNKVGFWKTKGGKILKWVLIGLGTVAAALLARKLSGKIKKSSLEPSSTPTPAQSPKPSSAPTPAQTPTSASAPTPSQSPKPSSASTPITNSAELLNSGQVQDGQRVSGLLPEGKRSIEELSSPEIFNSSSQRYIISGVDPSKQCLLPEGKNIITKHAAVRQKNSMAIKQYNDNSNDYLNQLLAIDAKIRALLKAQESKILNHR